MSRNNQIHAIGTAEFERCGFSPGKPIGLSTDVVLTMLLIMCSVLHIAWVRIYIAQFGSSTRTIPINPRVFGCYWSTSFV